jgi:hypothetical protein
VLIFSSTRTNQSDYIGACSSSNTFLQNTIIVPFNCTAKSLVFSIRELSAATAYSATLYVNGAPSNFTCSIEDGSVAFYSSASDNIPLTIFDLISIRIEFGTGSLPRGVTCALIIS